MTLAHLGVALGIRSLQGHRSGSVVMLALLAASLMPDIVDVAYFLLAICNPYGLYSHTIHAVALQAAVASGIAFLVTGSRGTAIVFAVVVLLHPLGDLVTGRKLLVPGGEMYGYRLYSWPLRNFLVEISLVIGGWVLLTARRGAIPAWVTSPQFLALLAGLQFAFALYGMQRPPSLKPNACPVVQVVSSQRVWSPRVAGGMLAERVLSADRISPNRA